MKLISSYELNKCSDSELAALFHTVWISLIRTRRGFGYCLGRADGG